MTTNFHIYCLVSDFHGHDKWEYFAVVAAQDKHLALQSFRTTHPHMRGRQIKAEYQIDQTTGGRNE